MAKETQNIFYKYSIYHRIPYNKKAVFIERQFYELGKGIRKFINMKETLRYIEHLPLIEKSINSRKNRMLGFGLLSPAEAMLVENQKLLARAEQEKLSKENEFIANHRKPPRFHVGDRVRVAYEPSQFRKGFKAKFSRQIFVISRIFRHRKLYMYELRHAASGKLYRKRVYEPEIQLHRTSNSNVRTPTVEIMR